MACTFCKRSRLIKTSAHKKWDSEKTNGYPVYTVVCLLSTVLHRLYEGHLISSDNDPIKQNLFL